MKKIFCIFLTSLLLISFCPSVLASGYTVVCEPRYNMAETMKSGVARVSEKSLWALFSKDGKILTGFSWETIGDTSADYIPAKKGDLWGYISPAGKLLIPYSFKMATPFCDGVALVKLSDGSYSYINTSGNIMFASPFDYSFAPSGGAICGILNGLYGYSDTDGNILISPKYEMAYDFHEGFAGVKSNGKWGFITTYGDFSVLPVYDSVSDFKNGYAVCMLNGKYGIINSKGAKCTSFTYDYIAAPDSSGRFPAKKGAVSGYINAYGEWVLETGYDYCYSFTNGTARVYKDGLWGYINEDGKEIVPPTFIDCGEYHNGLAPFSLDGLLWGYLTLDLNYVHTNTPVPDEEPPVDENIPVIQNPAISDEEYPLAPDSANCLSIKIGSTVALNNATVSILPAAPALADGVTMVPVRGVVEALGGTVSWDAKSGNISVKYKTKTILMNIGSKIFFVNGTPTPLGTSPEIMGSSTMMPLRNVVELLGCSLKWIDESQNIYIYY